MPDVVLHVERAVGGRGEDGPGGERRTRLGDGMDAGAPRIGGQQRRDRATEPSRLTVVMREFMEPFSPSAGWGRRTDPGFLLLQRAPLGAAIRLTVLQAFAEGRPALLRDDGRGKIPSAIGMLVILHGADISHESLTLQRVQVVYYVLWGVGDTAPAIGETLQ